MPSRQFWEAFIEASVTVLAHFIALATFGLFVWAFLPHKAL